MKSFNEIYQGIYKECGEELKKLKEENRIRNIIFIISGVIFFICGIIFYNFVFIILGIIGIVVFLIIFSKKFGEYKLIYKEKIIKSFIKGYSEKLDYYPQQGISSRIYNMADFDGYYDRYHSEDLIEGTILDNCRISMSEVHTEREEETTDSDGNTTTHYVTIFHGLFACINLDSLITVSFRITKNKLFSGIFKGKQRLEMDSGEFEKIFDVSTEDKIGTLRLLTSDIMQMLIDFKTENKVTPEIVLKNNILYIRFAVGNVFEPNLIKNDMDFDKLKRNYDMINFIFILTEDFCRNIIEFDE